MPAETLGFYMPWDEASRRSLRANAGQLSWVAAGMVSVRGRDHRWIEAEDAALQPIMAANPKARLLLMIQNDSETGWDGANMARLLASADKRQILLAHLAKAMARHKASGAFFDIEDLPASAHDDYRTLLAEARTRLPASLLGPPPRPLRPLGRRHRCLVRHRSGARFQGAPFAAGYAVTKSFVQSLGEGLAVELATDNIDVLTLAPGPTHTGFAARAGLKMGMALGVAEVADAAVAAIGTRGTSFPGWLAKLLRTLTGTVPRWVATRIFGKVMADMAA
jgi:NAD(P)-dependent dehydrogenase (short-subunit alcohol dehydrogenase family)